jgi:hypothetical protein
MFLSPTIATEAPITALGISFLLLAKLIAGTLKR